MEFEVINIFKPECFKRHIIDYSFVLITLEHSSPPIMSIIIVFINIIADN